MMYVVHIRSLRRKILAGTVFLLLVIGLAALLGGCFDQDADLAEPVMLSSNEDRISYLNELGWETGSNAVEALEIQLPEELTGDWADYAKLQQEQHFSFNDYAGQAVQRYTYAVKNYPDVPDGVQINLYLCNDALIGGDLIATGENGFQCGIAYPEKLE